MEKLYVTNQREKFYLTFHNKRLGSDGRCARGYMLTGKHKIGSDSVL